MTDHDRGALNTEPTAADPAIPRVIEIGPDGSVVVDGEDFPYPIEYDRIDIERSRGAFPAVTVRIPAHLIAVTTGLEARA